MNEKFTTSAQQLKKSQVSLKSKNGELRKHSTRAAALSPVSLSGSLIDCYRVRMSVALSPIARPKSATIGHNSRNGWQ